MLIEALRRGYYFDSGAFIHPRGQFFMFRLFADWQGISYEWPSHALDEPVYNELITHWRDADTDLLTNLILVACDRHTHQCQDNKSGKYLDFSYPTMYYLPVEILMLYRLRQLHGLQNPEVDHPLLNTPLGKLPEIQPEYTDELLEKVLARARKELPDF